MPRRAGSIMIAWIILNWRLIAVAVALAGTAWATHAFDAARHQAAIATLQAQAATTLAQAQAQARATEQAALAKLMEQDNAYAQLAQTTKAAESESRRLSADLSAATARLRRLARPAGGGGGSLPATGPSPDGCQDLRAALDRALGAVERLESGGDAVAELGQAAVDVATIAAQAAGAH